MLLASPVRNDVSVYVLRSELGGSRQGRGLKERDPFGRDSYGVTINLRQTAANDLEVHRLQMAFDRGVKSVTVGSCSAEVG